MLHSATIFHSGEFVHGHYKLTLERNFWACSQEATSDSTPYRIAVAGHGGFAVRRDAWNDVGRYWPGFVGYGGEEMYFDLKMWLLGKTVWFDNRMRHYHYSGERTYARHYSNDYYLNLLMSANIIGGEDWAFKVCASFLRQSRPSSTENPFELMSKAISKSHEHSLWLKDKRIMSLEDLLVYFDNNNVLYR